MNEKLLSALEQISDEHIAQAATRKKGKRPYWIGPIAAVLAITILASVFLMPPRSIENNPATTPSTNTPVNTELPVLEMEWSKYNFDDFISSLSDRINSGELTNYVVNISGLCTPVTVQMENMDVVHIEVYGHTISQRMYQFHDTSSLSIIQWEDAIILQYMEDVCLGSWIATSDQLIEHQFPIWHEQDAEIHMDLYVDEQNQLRFIRYIPEYMTTLNQDELSAITLFDNRVAFVYDEGFATIGENNLELDVENWHPLQELYDLEAIFASAKEQGMFAEFDTLDDYFESKVNTDIWSTAVWDSNLSLQTQLAEHFDEDRSPFFRVEIDCLCTPVIIEMYKNEITSIQVYDNVIPSLLPDYNDSVETELFIMEYEDSIILQAIDEQCLAVWMVTPSNLFGLEHGDNDTFTQLFEDENGQLRYVTYAFPYPAMDKYAFPQLTFFNDRNDFFYEEGTVTLTHSGFDLNMENTYTISDKYNLDAIFAEAQEAGLYTEYESVDELFYKRQFPEDTPPENTPPENTPPEDTSPEDIPKNDENLVLAQKLTGIHISDWNNQPVTYRFYYDGNRLLSREYIQSDYLRLDTTYDGSYRRPTGTSSYRTYGGANDLEISYDYTYDRNGNCITVVYTDHLSNKIRREERSYDADNRLTHAVIYWNDVKDADVTYEYDAAGNLIRELTQYSEPQLYYSDDTPSYYSQHTTTYAYNEAGQLIAMTHADDIQGVYNRFTYAYDEAGRQTNLYAVTDYQYDENGMLQSLMLAGSPVTFEYETVYVTQEEAREMLDMLNDVLGNWALAYVY
ncbi:MAG: RHS repeat protein [Oscillospiraceae bacterium]|nr:RHS repeat protein [Oscillospiraceae bacterium]